jgi:uncharacterized delta-60 repeat protein
MAGLRGLLRVLPVGALLVTQVVLSPPANAAPGDLDRGFGVEGKVTTEFVGGGAEATSVALQPDGKIVAAGSVVTGSSQVFALTRYNADGSLDSSFGTGGKTTTDFAGDFDVASAVALQPDGKIVATGFTGVSDTDRVDFALARYNSDGTLDSSFGTGGRVITDFARGADLADAMALQPDGKIVVAGITFTPSRLGDMALARYNPNGTLDSSFGAGGEVTTDFGDHDGAFAVALQPDGKIVAAGFTAEDFALARYTSDGTLDPAFGAGGKVTTDFGTSDDDATAVALQADGKIVAVGGRIPSTSVTRDFALARYNPDGSPDPSFGTGGKITTDFAGAYDLAEAVALQPDGRIVAAGLSGVFAQNLFDFALARYNPDGSPDPSFGTGGKVTTDFSSGNDAVSGVALQPDGKIVAAGLATIGSSQDFAVARYEGGAALKVPIDIKPGSTTNPVKFSSSGRIPVAILATSSFDATTVDPSGVCFGDAESPVQRDCTESRSSLEDVNGDGRLDLLLLFETRQTGIDPGDTHACLTGRTFAGMAIQGCDSVVAR